MSSKIFSVDDIVDVVGPSNEMVGQIQRKSTLIAFTPPGCWGPMITPAIKSGHEVTGPVAVAGAKVGDAIVMKINRINILSRAGVSGTDKPHDDRLQSDPFVDPKCPNCEEINPETTIEGVGKDSIKCKNCGESINPFEIPFGFTMLFDEQRNIGLTVPAEITHEIASQASSFSVLPGKSKQCPANILASSDLTHTISRLRPMVGNIGTIPAIDMPSSHNAGDFGEFLVGAKHKYGIQKEDLASRTDGHMDINEVCEGAVLIAPVKVDGGGIYVGDVHALQGDGEIAGHTVDVSAEVTLQVDVIENLQIDGPILLPKIEDLPRIAQPLSQAEKEMAFKLADDLGIKNLEESYPIQFVGTGANLNDAIDNGINRAAKFMEISKDEALVRATINGSIEIGRAPGVIAATILVPKSILSNKNLYELASEQYSGE